VGHVTVLDRAREESRISEELKINHFYLSPLFLKAVKESALFFPHTRLSDI